MSWSTQCPSVSLGFLVCKTGAAISATKCFNKHLLNISYVSDAVLGARHTAMNKTKMLAPSELKFSRGRQNKINRWIIRSHKHLGMIQAERVGVGGSTRSLPIELFNPFSPYGPL